MGNYFPYAFENKRYHTWNYHLKNKFGQKIFKVALDGGFDCLTVMALLHMVGARSVQRR